MAITSPFPVTAVVGRKEEILEHMTTFSFSLCHSPQEKGRMKNSKEKYFLENRRKKAAPEKQQTHWQHTSTCSREASTFPPSWGCPHCSWSWFSSLWARRMHFSHVQWKEDSSKKSDLHSEQNHRLVTEMLMYYVFKITFAYKEGNFFGKALPQHIKTA